MTTDLDFVLCSIQSRYDAIATCTDTPTGQDGRWPMAWNGALCVVRLRVSSVSDNI